jgi:hypothetical protein
MKLIISYFSIVSIIATFAANEYAGDSLLFFIFTFVFNVLLLMGIRKNANFFDFYIGIFFWIGFWLKLTVRILFFDTKFSEATGAFDYSGGSFDSALIICICAACALIFGSLIREKLFPKLITKIKANNFEEQFYWKKRNYIIIIFIILFLTISYINVRFGIYQKGEITKTIFPYQINGLIKWLLIFGLASFSALILKIEIDKNKKIPLLLLIVIILESFFSNTSLLSRGMILNTGAIAIGVLVILRKNNLFLINLKKIILSSIIFCILFAMSIIIVNDLRGNGSGIFRLGILGELFNKNNESQQTGYDLEHATPLLLNRWVGIEGVLSVSSSKRLGLELWNEAWSERYSENTMGFYDSNLIDSPYKNTDFKKNHYISLPGITAFLFYPGSLIFLFFSMLSLSILASIIELFVFKVGGENLILCSLISMVVAYRYTSFGYVPFQSYLLFGSIIISTFIINFINLIFSYSPKN